MMKIRRKILSVLLVIVMLCGLTPAVSFPSLAEEPSSDQFVELTTTTTQTLVDGKTYYIENDLTINSNKANKNGLVIDSNATVTISIPAGKTLTVYGKDGSGATGGGAAILLRDGATLIVVGNGKLVAVGGKAGNGTVGDSGTGSYVNDNVDGNYEYLFGSKTVYQAGKGGNGGYGGGGAGAGIGTDGGQGGYLSGSGGSGWEYLGESGTIRDSSRNGYSGSKGSDGSSASASGIFVCASTIDVSAVKGGSAGSSGGAGSAGYSGYDGDESDARGIAGGAGGGGGGGGLAGADIGTGGGGGGQGGGGGSAGYIWGGRFVGGGGGGGGGGANGGSGGTRGSVAEIPYKDCENDRVDNIISATYSSSGYSGSNPNGGNGGNGADMTIENNKGDTTWRGIAGSGGSGGKSGNAAIKYTSDDGTGKYILMIAWDNGNSGGGSGGDPGENSGGNFGFTEDEQKLDFDLNTLYWNDAFSNDNAEDSFYYILCDENGNPIKDSEGLDITGPVTFDPGLPNTSANIVLPEGLPAGNYTVKIGSTASEKEALPAGGFEIEPKPLDKEKAPISFNDTDININPPVYNGDVIKPGFTITHNETSLIEGVDYIVTYDDNVDAGEATMTVTFIGNYSGSFTETFNIVKCDPTLDIPEGQTTVYDRAAVEANNGSGDIQYNYDGDGSITVKWYADTEGEKGKEISVPTAAGTYWLGVSAAEGKNYNAVAEAVEKFVISPYELQDGDVAIDPDEFIYNANEQGPAVIVKHGVVTLVNNTEYIISNRATGENADTYTVTVTGVNNYSGTVNKIWNINKATPEVSVSPVASSITYGDSLADSVLSGGTVLLDSIPVSGSFTWANPETEPVVADSNTTYYTVNFTPEDLVNYNPISCTVQLTVHKADQAAPDAVTKTDESIMDKDDGVIDGLSDLMEYKYNDGSWTDVGGTSLENLPAGDYDIRYKATPNHNDGEITEVTIEEGRYLVVNFKTFGGDEIAPIENATYNCLLSDIEDPTKNKHHFAGWFKDEDCKQAWNFAKDTVTIDTTLYAKWSKNPVYSVGGSMEMGGVPLEGATIEIKRGNETLAATVTDNNGDYVFENLPDGTYNAIITKDDKVMTVLVTVKDGVIDVTSIDVPAAPVSSNVVVVEDSEVDHVMSNTTGTIIEGLADIATAQAPGLDEHVTVQMVITPKADVTQEESHPDKPVQEAIKEKAPDQVLEFFDLTLSRVTSTSGIAGSPEDIGDSNSTILKIVIPFETNRVGNIVAYRYHDGVAVALNRNPGADEEGYEVGDNCVIIYSKSFSPYAIGYTLLADKHSVSVPKAENGTVSISPKNAAKGSKITVTPTPEEGYVVRTVYVYDKDGNLVPVTKNSDGTYSFKMPDGKVSVEVKFGLESDSCSDSDSCPMHRYMDLSTDEWYHDGVHYCIDSGLMLGVGDDLFVPNGTTSRAQIVTILWRMEGEPTVPIAEDFNDVPSNEWYYNAIRWASENKIVTGYGDSIFGPNDTITREQMASILWRYCNYKGIDVSVGEDTNILSSKDAADVSEWAMEAMQWACGSGMIQGIEKNNGMYLDPQGSAVRSQSATIIYRFCTNIL